MPALRATLAGALLLACVPAFAQAPSATGWYTGFGLGQSRLGFKTGDFTIAGPGTATSFDENNTAFKFFAGYRLLPWLAIEGGYDNLGRNTVNYAGAGGTAKLDYKVDALKLTGVGSIAFGNTGFSAFGKVGFGYTRVRENTNNFPPVVGRGEISDREWRISPVVGAGLQYQLPRGLALRAEYEHYNEVGDSPLPTGRARAGLWSLSLMYLF
jgi:OOP family OmpA-OmpF porin